MVKKKHKTTTPKKGKRITTKSVGDFLACLAQYGNVSRAAQEAGVDRCRMYVLRGQDAKLAEAWDEALSLGVEALEDEAKRRAYEGWDEPVWHQGKQCGTVQKFSDTLLIFLLKGHKPEKYRENQRIDHTSSDGSMTPATSIDLTHLNADELTGLAKAVFGSETECTSQSQT